MPYGRGMRSCCDSPAQRSSAHIRGCKNYRVHQKSGSVAHFVQMDDERGATMMDAGALEEFLNDNGYRLTEEIGIHSMVGNCAIQNSARNRVGILVSVGYDEEAVAI
jgi:hypothetical protein